MWLASNPGPAGKDRKGVSAGAWIVIGRPRFTVPLGKLDTSSVPGDDRPKPLELLEDDPKNYKVQLCSGTRRAGAIIDGLPQRFLKPWLSRPQAANPPPNSAEHPPIPAAREVAVNFSLFDAIPDKTVPPKTERRQRPTTTASSSGPRRSGSMTPYA